MKFSMVTKKFATGVILAFSINSQAAVTLENCREWGLIRNPSVLKIELERALDRPGKQVAIGQFLPSVSVGFAISRSSFYTPTYLNPDGSIATYPTTKLGYDTYIDPLGYIRVDTTSIRNVVTPIPEGARKASTSYLRIDETLFDGGKNYFNYKNALLSLDLREARSEDAKRLVRNAITHAYAKAVFVGRQLELAGRMATQRRMQLEYAKARLLAGSVTRRDVLQAEVELGRTISDSLNAALSIRRAFEELNMQIGLPLDTAITLSGIIQPTLPSLSIDDLENTAISRRSDAEVLKMRLLQRENDLKAEKGKYLPQLTTGISIDRSERSGTSESFTLNPRNKNTTIDLTLSWLLFDRFTRELSMQQTKVDQGKMEIELSNLRIEIRRQVRSAVETLQSILLQVKVASDNASLAEQSLEFEQERYRLGASTLIELNAAQLSFYQAHTEKIELESEYLSAFGDLEAAIGQPLLNK